MPRRASKNPTKRGDPNQLAARILREIEAKEEGKNPFAVALGRLGASKGGRARAEKLSPQARRVIARKAARARWKRGKSQ
jgi:hypothetical protein